MTKNARIKSSSISGNQQKPKRGRPPKRRTKPERKPKELLRGSVGVRKESPFDGATIQALAADLQKKLDTFSCLKGTRKETKRILIEFAIELLKSNWDTANSPRPTIPQQRECLEKVKSLSSELWLLLSSLHPEVAWQLEVCAANRLTVQQYEELAYRYKSSENLAVRHIAAHLDPSLSALAVLAKEAADLLPKGSSAKGPRPVSDFIKNNTCLRLEKIFRALKLPISKKARSDFRILHDYVIEKSEDLRKSAI